MKAFQIIKYDKILAIQTELDENQLNGLLKLNITEAKEVPYNLYELYR